MDSIVPIQYINKHFRTPIKQLQQTGRSLNSTYFTAITSYGTMSLIVENYTKNVGGIDTINFLQSRNELIKLSPHCFPAIYEQNICVNHPQQIACISLMECAQYLRDLKKPKKIRISNLSKFANCMCLLQKHNLNIQASLNYNDLLCFPNQQQVTFDFTSIAPGSMHKQMMLQQFRKCVQSLLPPVQEQQNQVILIQDKLFKFDSLLLKQANNFQQILFMFNLCPNISVQIQLKAPIKAKQKEGLDSPTKIRKKLVKMQELQGKQVFKIGQTQYSNFQFVEGKCINALRELVQNEQKITIFPNKCHLRIKKRQVIYLETVREELECDIITVEKQVQKIEFISFIICYLKIKQPSINSICYEAKKNCLKISYNNNLNQDRIVKIFFHPEYVVKDEEISMIVERAKLKNCQLDVRSMKINDSLLMFLANSEKTAKISEIHISDCYGITDNGINALVMSPFCKKMQALTLVLDENLFQLAIQCLSLRKQLKKLHLEQNRSLQHQTHNIQVNLQRLKIVQLCSVGINISLDHINLQNLKILRISQQVHVDELKVLKNARLTELKIRLNDLGKKGIIESTSSFLTGTLINRNNPVRTFAEGSSSKSLKILDLSNSSAKFKSLKYLFNMPELEKLVLNDCNHLGHEFEPISPKILHLSLARTQISVLNLGEMLQKTSIMVQINLTGNKSIAKQDLVKYIESRKKFFNNLIVCENCYSNRLIQKMGGNSSNGFELVENVGLSVGKLASQQKEDILFDILGKVIETPKVLKLLTDSNPSNLQKTIDQIERFMRGSGKSKKHFKNLYINHLRFAEAVQMLRRKAELFEPQSQQRTKTSQKNCQINIPQSYTIQQLTHKIRTLPGVVESMVVNLKDNKIIGKQCIKMLYEQVQDKLGEINFRNCIFSFDEVIEYLFEFPMLSNVNDGICSLHLDRDNFGTHSQQYLKFFMKLTKIDELSIVCKDIEQTQLLYSVLYHVLDKHAETLTKLSVQLNGVTVNKDGEMFIAKIFDLANLQSLVLQLSDCHILNANKKQNWFDALNQLTQLRRLRLKINEFNAPTLSLKNLEEVSLSFNNSSIHEQEANKVMKNLYWCPIKKLQLDFSYCSSIASLNKVFSSGASSTIIEKLHSLQHIRINLEYCALKQNSLYELINSFSKCPRLKKIQLNVSFAVTNLNELVNKIHLMLINIGREIKVHVISVTPTSSQFSYNRSYFEPNGVTFTF